MKMPALLSASLIAAALCLPASAQDTALDSPQDAAANSEPQDRSAANEEAELAVKTAVVQRHVDAYRARDLDRFVATFSKDAQVYANGMVATGHSQIRALYKLNFAPGAPRMKIIDSGVSGAFIYLETAYITAGGEELCCGYSEYEVIDGKITYLSASS